MEPGDKLSHLRSTQAKLLKLYQVRYSDLANDLVELISGFHVLTRDARMMSFERPTCCAVYEFPECGNIVGSRYIYGMSPRSPV